jgi:hypothetical protein
MIERPSLREVITRRARDSVAMWKESVFCGQLELPRDVACRHATRVRNG